MSLVFHDYRFTTELPQEVLKLLHPTTVSLPEIPLSVLSSYDPYSTSTPFEQARQTLRDSLKLLGIDDAICNELVSILYMILSTCAGLNIELLSADDDDGYPHHTMSTWYALLNMLGTVCFKDSATLADVPVVKPKGFDGEQLTALALIIYVGDRSTLPDVFLTASSPLAAEEDHKADPRHSHSNSPKASVSYHSQSCEDEDHTGCEYEVEENDIRDSDENIDGSYEDEDGHELREADETEYVEDEDEYQDADPDDMNSDERYHHMLRNHPIFDTSMSPHLFPKANVAVPPATEADDIGEDSEPVEWLDLPLDAHILASRGSYNCVLFPIVCVAEEKDIVPLIASCMYQRRAWGINLPVVGLAMSRFGHTAHVHIGWFDEEGQDIHIFSPFQGHQSHAELDVAAAGVFDLADSRGALGLAFFILSLRDQFEKLHDTIKSQEVSRLGWRADDDSPTWNGTITGWLRTIDNTLGDTRPVSQSSSTLRGEMSSSSRKVKADELGSLAPSADSISHTGSQHSEPASDRSCSRFAMRPEQSVKDDNPSIVSWMIFRSAFSVACYHVPLEPRDMYGPPELHNMVDIYNDLTSLRWVEQWKTLNDLPDDMAQYSVDYKTTLLKEYEDFSTSRLDENERLDDLGKDHAKIVSGKFALLMNIVAEAHTTTRALTNVLEAESRYAWDEMLKSFYVSAGEFRSQDVLKATASPTFRLRDTALRSSGSEATADANNWYRKVLRWNNHNNHVLSAIIAALKTFTFFGRQCEETSKASRAIMLDVQRLVQDIDCLRSSLRKHTKYEPTRGTCDAIVTVSLDALIGRSGLTRCTEMYKKSGLVVTGRPTTQHWAPLDPAVLETPIADIADAESMSRPREEIWPLCSKPLNVPCIWPDSLESKPLAGLNQASSKSTEPQLRLHFPQLVVHYKKPQDTFEKALSQARMYCVASVSFLAALGIKRCPVFSMATHGTIGHVLMGWMSDHEEHENVIYIMECNVRKFDLSKPLQALQFTTFLLRLKAHSERFAADFEKNHLDGYMKALLDPESPCCSWAMPDSAGKDDNDDDTEFESVQGGKADRAALRTALKRGEDDTGLSPQFQAMNIKSSHETKIGS